MKKIYPMLRIKQIIHNPIYLFFYLKRFFFYKKSSFKYEEKYKNIKQLNEVDTLKYIIENNKSIARFNDGELAMFCGGGAFYGTSGPFYKSSWSQIYSKELEKETARVLSSKNKNFIIAPTPISLMFSKINNEMNEVNMHTEARMSLYKYISDDQIYGSGAIFMLNIHKNINWDLISDYIKNKNVIIVTGNTENLKDIKLGKQTFFIDCGIPHNAFKRINEIKEKINKFIDNEKLKKEESLFMISMGPSAIFIVEHISGLGYTAWDTGHIFKNSMKEITTRLEEKSN